MKDWLYWTLAAAFVLAVLLMVFVVGSVSTGDREEAPPELVTYSVGQNGQQVACSVTLEMSGGPLSITVLETSVFRRVCWQTHNRTECVTEHKR